MKSSSTETNSTWVIKIGSGVLFKDDGLDIDAFEKITRTISLIKKSGRKVVLVSSGAVALGRKILKKEKLDANMAQLQALAAVGQVSLIELYKNAFATEGITVAQVLFGRDDLNNRKRYLNAEETLLALLAADVLPIINENDTVSTDELRFGDNDELAAMTCGLVSARMLIIFSVAPGIRDLVDGKLKDVIPFIASDDERLESLALPTRSEMGRGGMLTKISACKLAARFNTTVAIGNGKDPYQILSLANISGGSDFAGTMVVPSADAVRGPKVWLTAAARVSGKIYCDMGAIKAICERGSSLLPAGVLDVEDDFLRGRVVELLDETGLAFARGVAVYSSSEIQQILGKKSDEIKSILGFRLSDTIIHRDSLVVF